MKFGIVGLGRMGANLAVHAGEKGHAVIAYDQSERAREEGKGDGLEVVASLAELVHALTRPRAIFLYVPHGTPTEESCLTLKDLLNEDDIVVDGGNSHWEDSKRR